MSIGSVVRINCRHAIVIDRFKTIKSLFNPMR